MAKLIDGKLISTQIKEELKEEVTKLKEEGIVPCLAVVQVGKDPASSVYVNNKKKACAFIGIESLSYELDETVAEEELLSLVQKLNEDEKVNGILVQLPLPAHIREDAVIQAIAPEKDVDGFHPESVGNMCIGRNGFLPCTPAGIIELLKRSEIEIEGKECVVVGRSNIVGKPMALLLLRENGTVTITHSRTRDLKEITGRADILIAAIGKPKFITSDYIKEGAVVIDVGIHRNAENKLCGDVDFDDVIETILMGMLYSGKIETMMPKLHSTNFEGMELIRPMYLIKEADIIGWRDYNQLNFIQCACRFTENCATCGGGRGSKRDEMKELIAQFREESNLIEKNIFRSVHNVNLRTIIGYHKDDDIYNFLDDYDERGKKKHEKM